MSGFTSNALNNILLHFTGQAATIPTTAYIGLCNGDPGLTGDITGIEPSEADGYARIELVTADAWSDTPTALVNGASISNDQTIQIGPATAQWDVTTLTHGFLATAGVAGVNDVVISFELPQVVTIGATTTPPIVFAADSLTITLTTDGSAA